MLRWKRILLGAAGVYIALAATAWALQGQLVYNVDPTRVLPSALGLEGIREHNLAVGNGESLVVWRATAKAGQPTLLYFPGNAGNLGRRKVRFAYFTGRGLGLYAVNYRGYGGSTGRPSEATIVADARRAYDDLVASGTRPADIVFYGESLGTGVAARLASEKPAAGLILDAPYTSMADVGAREYPFLPVHMLLTERYETINIINGIKMPLLVVHGTADPLVPTDMGRAVYAKAREPKQLALIEGAGHSNHGDFGSYEKMMDFIRGLGDAGQRRANPKS